MVACMLGWTGLAAERAGLVETYVHTQVQLGISIMENETKSQHELKGER
jgi:hypothetical protein